MRCPNCGSGNDEGAASCALCSIVFNDAPPAPAVHEPAKLDTDGAVSMLLSLAVAEDKEGRFEDSERLLARLYLEAPPETCRNLLYARGDEWLKVAGLAAAETAAAQALIVTIGAYVGEGELAEAADRCAALIALIPAPTPESYRLRMLLLGVKGAADAKNR
jgi:hypothetical protein